VSEFLPYLIIGITVGSIYGLSAMGLVLTYKTSGVFNLAHGSIGAGAAYLFLELRQRHGMSWPLALVVSVLVFGVLVGLVMERLAEGLARVPAVYRIVATVGLLVATLGLLGLLFGTQLLTFEHFLSRDPVTTVSGVRISQANLAVFGVGCAAAVILSVLFRCTRIGTAMRAVVDDSQLLDMTGQSPTLVRRYAWLIGTCFAALSGVLFAETQQAVDAIVLSFLIVQAFGAAAIGAFRSIPLAYVGGIVVGLAQAVTSKQIAGHQFLAGLDTNMPFLVLLVILICLPRGRLVEVGKLVKARAVPPSSLPVRTRFAGGSAVLVGALVLPLIVGSRLPLWTNALSQVVLFSSLGLLVYSSGQISLCQWGFAAVGATTFAHMLRHGLPWGLAVLVAALVAVPVGALVSLPAIRLSGLYLGLATLGFGVLLAGFFYQRGFMFGVGTDLATHRPHFLNLDSERGFYYLLLAIAVAALGLVAVIERSRLGRLLRGLADSPVALSTLGTNINQTRMIVFSISAFLAGLAGALYSSLFGSINVDSFNYLVSIQIIAVLVVSGRRTVTASVLAPLLFVVLPGYIRNGDFALYEQIGFGVFAVAAALLSQTSLRDRLSRAVVAEDGRRSVDRTVRTTPDRIAALSAVRTSVTASS
jgi:ABC-type branched-subunit amino acid transport system permease subunit